MTRQAPEHILMVTPFAPVRDGIASYAAQQVRALRAQGHEVTVLSPGPSAAHLHLDLLGPRGAAALAKRVRGFDRVVIQFHPDFFYHHPSTPAAHAATSLALAGMIRAAHRVDVVLHEVDFRIGQERSVRGRAMRAMWQSVGQVLVHTVAERDKFISSFGVDPQRVSVTLHGSAFSPATRHTRESARASLGIPADDYVFLCIGFIQPHKGFDRAVSAFDGLGAHGARLYVVGSVRVEDAAFMAHLERLIADAAATPGVEINPGYLTDEIFDRWIVAADCLVLPYRNIWSSGVAERAAIYGRSAIVTRVGGLGDQTASRPEVTVVDDDAGLRRAMRTAVGLAHDNGARVAEPWPADGPQLRERVQAEVLRRAASRRSSAPAHGKRPAVASVINRAAASAPVRSVSPLKIPEPISGRPGVTGVKRSVARVVGWLVNPLYEQVNDLREATIVALEEGARPPAQSESDD